MILRFGIRCFSTNHPYQILPVTSSSDLAKNLLNEIIYDSDGIVAFNKPYGVSFACDPKAPKKMSIGNYKVSLLSTMPYLEKLLGRKLIKVKSPEKHVSGVSIFCDNEKLAEKLKMRLSVAGNEGVGVQTYLAIVVGSPKQYEDRFDGAMTLHTKSGSKEKKVGFTTDWTKSMIRRGAVKRVTISHKTLSHSCAGGDGDSTLASLLEVVCSRGRKWHCVRAYLASVQAAPSLGDTLFGPRVKTILGVPVAIDPFSPAAAPGTQKLPDHILDLLDMKSRNNVTIPLHLHLAGVLIKNVRKGRDLLLRAPPPEFFNWTCEKLGIHVPEIQVDEKVRSVA